MNNSIKKSKDDRLEMFRSIFGDEWFYSDYTQTILNDLLDSVDLENEVCEDTSRSNKSNLKLTRKGGLVLNSEST